MKKFKKQQHKDLTFKFFKFWLKRKFQAFIN